MTIAVNRNLSNCEKARKKGFRGFNGIRTRGLCVSAAVLYQPELWRPIHWKPANLLSSSTRERNETQNEMMWTAGIQMKWVCDHRSESRWSHTHFVCMWTRFTAMVTYSFHLYSRSSHHFILWFSLVPFISLCRRPRCNNKYEIIPAHPKTHAYNAASKPGGAS